MNAITFLENQHREIEALFERVGKIGEGQAKDRKSLFALLALKIEHHAKIEETVFYPQGKKAGEERTWIAYEEHDVVRFLVRKIVKMRPADRTFSAKLTVLKSLLGKHVEGEEKEYFPLCTKELGEEKLEELGTELALKYEKLQSSVTSKRSARKAVAK
jgi:hemerythrin-like domain-containing protein